MGRGTNQCRQRPRRGPTGLGRSPRSFSNTQQSLMETIYCFLYKLGRGPRKICLDVHCGFPVLFQGRAGFSDFLSGGILETSFSTLSTLTAHSRHDRNCLIYHPPPPPPASLQFGEKGKRATDHHLSHPAAPQQTSSHRDPLPRASSEDPSAPWPSGLASTIPASTRFPSVQLR